MNKKLYVGNLNYDTTEDKLRDVFSEIGTVESVAIITDRMTGRSKGFAFVEMETEEDAQAAIEQVSNKVVDGRTITVAEARPPRDRSSGGGRDRRGGGGGGGSGYGGGGPRRRQDRRPRT
ncbi:MAG: RNA-binding protein [Anaerolineales bacterium]|nr:RNA-binding protein [Anaerolineales bacterium]